MMLSECFFFFFREKEVKPVRDDIEVGLDRGSYIAVGGRTWDSDNPRRSFTQTTERQIKLS